MTGTITVSTARLTITVQLAFGKDNLLNRMGTGGGFSLPGPVTTGKLTAMSQQNENIKMIARNRKARHDFHIESSLEAGIELKGSEVKSIREGKINLSDAYAVVEDGQVILKNLHISPYKMAQEQPEPIRNRRLLLHKREIAKLWVKTQQKGMSLVPLAVYFKGRVAKVELGVGVGRKKYDKREAIAKAEADRRMQRAIRKDID